MQTSGIKNDLKLKCNITFLTISGEKFMRRIVCIASNSWSCFASFWIQLNMKFNMTSVKILNAAEDPVLLNVISKMCEMMFDVHINCTFERHNKMLNQTEKVLVEFLLQTTVHIKHHLKYTADKESVDLPSGYIESGYF